MLVHLLSSHSLQVLSVHDRSVRAYAFASFDVLSLVSSGTTKGHTAGHYDPAVSVPVWIQQCILCQYRNSHAPSIHSRDAVRTFRLRDNSAWLCAVLPTELTLVSHALLPLSHSATTPKLLIHAFIGQRTYMFADPDSRHAMDSQTKLLNGLYIALGSLLSAATSYYVYKLTMRQVELASTGAGAGTGGGGRAGQEVDLEAALLDDVDELLGQDARDQDQDGQDLDDDDDDDDEHSGGGTAGVRDHDHDRTRVKRLGRSLDRHDIVELDVLGDTTSKLDSDGRSGYQGHLERYRDEPQGAENGVGKSQAGQIGSGVGRMSEDRWDGSISDFGDHTEEQERRGRETGRDADEEEDDAEADDGWGLDMESIEEDGGVEHGSVADRLVSFAVEDDAVARPVTQKQRRD